jgi:hypothetical protein
LLDLHVHRCAAPRFMATRIEKNNPGALGALECTFQSLTVEPASDRKRIICEAQLADVGINTPF